MNFAHDGVMCVRHSIPSVAGRRLRRRHQGFPYPRRELRASRRQHAAQPPRRGPAAEPFEATSLSRGRQPGDARPSRISHSDAPPPTPRPTATTTSPAWRCALSTASSPRFRGHHPLRPPLGDYFPSVGLHKVRIQARQVSIRFSAFFGSACSKQLYKEATVYIFAYYD